MAKTIKLVVVGKRARDTYHIPSVKVPSDPADPSSREAVLTFKDGVAEVPAKGSEGLVSLLGRFYAVHVDGSESHKAALAAQEAAQKAPVTPAGGQADKAPSAQQKPATK